MKVLKTALIASVMFVGVANASCCVSDCCVTSCCETTCVQDVVKLVPYQVCVDVTDACGNVIGQKYVTRYRRVVVQEAVSCCN